MLQYELEVIEVLHIWILIVLDVHLISEIYVYVDDEDEYEELVLVIVADEWMDEVDDDDGLYELH